MKKHIFLFLTCALALSCMFGCGKTDANKELIEKYVSMGFTEDEAKELVSALTEDEIAELLGDSKEEDSKEKKSEDKKDNKDARKKLLKLYMNQGFSEEEAEEIIEGLSDDDVIDMLGEIAGDSVEEKLEEEIDNDIETFNSFIEDDDSVENKSVSVDGSSMELSKAWSKVKPEDSAVQIFGDVIKLYSQFDDVCKVLKKYDNLKYVIGDSCVEDIMEIENAIVPKYKDEIIVIECGDEFIGSLTFDNPLSIDLQLKDCVLTRVGSEGQYGIVKGICGLSIDEYSVITHDKMVDYLQSWYGDEYGIRDGKYKISVEPHKPKKQYLYTIEDEEIYGWVSHIDFSSNEEVGFLYIDVQGGFANK